jgi:hypothetical protein
MLLTALTMLAGSLFVVVLRIGWYVTSWVVLRLHLGALNGLDARSKARTLHNAARMADAERRKAMVKSADQASRKAWLDTCRTVCTWRDGLMVYRLMRPDGTQAASIAFRGDVPACETVTETETERADAAQDWLDAVTRKVCKPRMSTGKRKRKAGRPRKIRF